MLVTFGPFFLCDSFSQPKPYIVFQKVVLLLGCEVKRVLGLPVTRLLLLIGWDLLVAVGNI